MLQRSAPTPGDTLTPSLENLHTVPLSSSSSSPSQRIAALHLGLAKQLFVDDALIDKERSWGWQLKLGPRSLVNEGEPISLGPYPNATKEKEDDVYENPPETDEMWGTVMRDTHCSLVPRDAAGRCFR